MQTGRIIFGSAISFVAWTLLASFTYCLGFSRFDLSLAFNRFHPPYCQWFEVVWYWLTYDTSERVQFWLIVSAVVPTIAGVFVAFASVRNASMPRRQLSRWRWPWEDNRQPRP